MISRKISKPLPKKGSSHNNHQGGKPKTGIIKATIASTFLLISPLIKGCGPDVAEPDCYDRGPSMHECHDTVGMNLSVQGNPDGIFGNVLAKLTKVSSVYGENHADIDFFALNEAFPGCYVKSDWLGHRTVSDGPGSNTFTIDDPDSSGDSLKLKAVPLNIDPENKSAHVSFEVDCKNEVGCNPIHGDGLSCDESRTVIANEGDAYYFGEYAIHLHDFGTRYGVRGSHVETVDAECNPTSKTVWLARSRSEIFDLGDGNFIETGMERADRDSVTVEITRICESPDLCFDTGTRLKCESNVVSGMIGKGDFLVAENFAFGLGNIEHSGGKVTEVEIKAMTNPYCDVIEAQLIAPGDSSPFTETTIEYDYGTSWFAVSVSDSIQPDNPEFETRPWAEIRISKPCRQ
jgi:hypothetical protein